MAYFANFDFVTANQEMELLSDIMVKQDKVLIVASSFKMLPVTPDLHCSTIPVLISRASSGCKLLRKHDNCCKPGWLCALLCCPQASSADGFDRLVTSGSGQGKAACVGSYCCPHRYLDLTVLAALSLPF